MDDFKDLNITDKQMEEAIHLAKIIARKTTLSIEEVINKISIDVSHNGKEVGESIKDIIDKLRK